jgi:hypothetical protein
MEKYLGLAIILCILLSCNKEDAPTPIKRPKIYASDMAISSFPSHGFDFQSDFGKDSIRFYLNGQNGNFLFFDYRKEYNLLTFYTSKYNYYWCKRSYLWVVIPEKLSTDTLYSLNYKFAYGTIQDCDVYEDIYQVDTSKVNNIYLHYDSTTSFLTGYFDVKMVIDPRWPKTNYMNPNEIFFQNCRFRLKLPK